MHRMYGGLDGSPYGPTVLFYVSSTPNTKAATMTTGTLHYRLALSRWRTVGTAQSSAKCRSSFEGVRELPTRPSRQISLFNGQPVFLFAGSISDAVNTP